MKKTKSNAQEIKAGRRRRAKCVAVPVCGGYALIPSSVAIRNATRASS